MHPLSEKRNSLIKLPALLYHYVGPKVLEHRFGALCVSSKRFERQIRWMSENGFRAITTQQWLSFRTRAQAIPFKPVLLTFDDGYADFSHYALPILQRYAFLATVFVTTRIPPTSWDVAPLMTPGQIRECAGQGVEFGSHSRTHPNLMELNERELHDEIAGSREDLSAILGQAVTSFAYPFGFWNEQACAKVREMFETAFTCEPGLNEIETDPHLLRRTMVQPVDTIIDTACRLEFGWSPLTVARARLSVRTRIRRLRSVLRARFS
jgi:peptidoglycan/xylan/chitin deacetylase (PgdA/CDA1 family)